MRRHSVVAFLISSSLALSGCTTVRPGEVGVARSFGQLADTPRDPGLIVHSPIGRSFVKVPVRLQNLEVELDLPAKEGLNVRAQVSILFRVVREDAPKLIETVGIDYERSLVVPTFRSSAADVSARHLAKDMHSGERGSIESAIAEQMNAVLLPNGLKVERVLMKSIQLPSGLYSAVEEKLEAEQSAERMQYVLLQEKQEAERRRIEAEGIRDAQRILEEGLSEPILAWRSIEALEALSQSNNTKIIITDGQAPFFLPDPTTLLDE